MQINRKKIVAGNWKMNKSLPEALQLVSEINGMVYDEIRKDVCIILCPPSPYLYPTLKLVEDKKIVIGAQNIHSELKGAYTGEVSATMLQSIGCQYVIIGHSERRQYFNENNLSCNTKINLALSQGISPIYCVGESLQERENNTHWAVIAEQIKEGLNGLDTKSMKNVVIAYEPIWAIGTGKTASPEQAEEVHQFIRKEIANLYSAQLAEEISILYGGSCNPGNASSLFACANIDGGLIGGASLQSRDFVDIIKHLN